MSASDRQLLDALHRTQDPAVVAQRRTASQWRRANARIAAAMHASLAKQRTARPPARNG